MLLGGSLSVLQQPRSIICNIGRQLSMKYACENCYTCCITASQQITYCALQTQCKQSVISYGQAVSFTILIIFLLTAALAGLYLAFRNRKLVNYEQQPQPQQNYEVAEEMPSQKSPQPPTPTTLTIENKSGKDLPINSRLSYRLRSKPKKSRSKVKKQQQQVQTERGLQ